MSFRKKLKEEIIIGSVIGTFLFLIALGIAYSYCKKRNALREIVLKNPVMTEATITKIASGKRCYGQYEFQINEIKYEGKTIGCYHGKAGDTICVKYNKAYPSYNIYCNNEEMENFWSDALSPTLIIFAIFVPISLVVTIFRIKPQLKQTQ